MAEVIIMPKLGFNMDEGQLVKWHKQVGDKVSKGEVLFEINTDKTTMPVEATADGVVLKIMLEEEEYAEVFTPIAVVGAEGEDADAALAAAGGAEEAPVVKEEAPVVKEEPKAAAPAPAAKPASTGEYQYDVIVIGGGPGGYVAAIKSAQMGKKTAIIEEKHFGGVCLNEGCIPTKTLIKTVNVLEEIKHAHEFGLEGVNVADIKVSMDKLQKRKQSVINQLVGGVQGLLRANKVTIVDGVGSFVDAHTVSVGDKTMTSENFIIATGSESFMPGFISYEGNTNIITSREALNLDHIPESVAIIGGGVIGIEFAYVLSLLGTKVTVLELMDNILPMVDEEISKMAQKSLEKQGVTFCTGAKVKLVSDLSVHYEKGGKEEKVTAEMTLMAVGRSPYTAGLNAEAIGVEFDRKAIKTDSHMRTNIENIYAIGDVNGTSMLAHTASHEGIVAVENICGHQMNMGYDIIPSCIYLEPEIASIGLTEKQAKEKYGEISVGKFPMAANGKSLVEGDTTGMMKVILDKEYGEILGVHMYAKHATDMISEICVAMNMEATAEEIIHSIHPHPTVSEGVAEAFMGAFYGKAIHSL